MKRNYTNKESIRLYRLNDEYVKYFNSYYYCGEPNLMGQEGAELIKASDIRVADTKYFHNRVFLFVKII